MLVSKVTLKAVGVCTDIQYNKKYISFQNMIELKISEILKINFESNVSDHPQKRGSITFISGYQF